MPNLMIKCYLNNFFYFKLRFSLQEIMKIMLFLTEKEKCREVSAASAAKELEFYQVKLGISTVKGS